MSLIFHSFYVYGQQLKQAFIAERAATSDAVEKQAKKTSKKKKLFPNPNEWKQPSVTLYNVYVAFNIKQIKHDAAVQK